MERLKKRSSTGKLSCAFQAPGQTGNPFFIPSVAMSHAMRQRAKKSDEEELLAGVDFQQSGDAKTFSVQICRSLANAAKPGALLTGER